MRAINLFLVLVCMLTIAACSNRREIEAYRKEGITALQYESYEEALDFFNLALKSGEGEVGNIQYDILLYKAECLFLLGRFTESRNIYDILLKVKKNSKQFNEIYEIINNFATLDELKVSLDNNDIEKSQKLLEELKQSGLEHDRAVIFNQAILYEKQGEWKYALDQFKYYLTQFPNDEIAQHEIDFITNILTSS